MRSGSSRTRTLTGLPNRRALDEAMEAAASRPAAVLFLDLDSFKAVNDAHGHAVGDALLRQAAARIRSAIREEDVVARTGGDEFVILLQGRRATDADAVAARIRDAVAEYFEIGGRSLSVDVSVGVASETAGLRKLADVMREADGAMYAAKRAGQGRMRAAGMVA